MRKVSLTVLLLLGTAFSAAADESTSVAQHRRQFVPAAVTINRGEIVSIRNEDPFFHHLYVDSVRFRFSSEEQKPDEVVRIRFPKAGEYHVQCKIHLKMDLRVSVQ